MSLTIFTNKIFRNFTYTIIIATIYDLFITKINNIRSLLASILLTTIISYIFDSLKYIPLIMFVIFGTIYFSESYLTIVKEFKNILRNYGI